MRSSSTSRDLERRGHRRWQAVALLVVVASVWPAATARAVDPERAVSQYIREQWGADRGFPGGAVHDITQTEDGYLWIAAEKGLVRFDGLAFKLFPPTGLTAAITPAVVGIVPEPGGGLWARLRGPALVRYRGGAFEHIPASANGREALVTAMALGRSGGILVATIGDGAAKYRNGRFTTIAGTAALTSSFVLAIAETADGDVWMGTRDSALLRVQGSRVSAITGGLPDRKINCLVAGDGRELWVGTDSGVVRWTGAEMSAAGLPPLLGRVRATAMIRDRDGNIWIATAADGLLRVNARGVTALADRNQSATAPVTALFEDADGNIWLGSARGIERLRDGVFATYATAQGLPSDTAGPVYVDEGQQTWFAPAQGGLYRLRDGRTDAITLDGLSHDVIYSIAGGAGEVWIGRQKGGLTRLRERGGVLTADSVTQAGGLAQNSVYAVCRARDGSVWAGTLSGGVSRFKDGVFTTYTTADGLASNTVAAILETSDGTMWFATPSGVNVLSRGGWRRYSTEEGLPSNDVNTLLEDSTGLVWAGTAAGLAAFRAGELQRQESLPAALRGSILGLAEERTGWLWVVTTDRVLRVNRARLELGQLAGQDVREYGVADGLLGVEGVKRHRSVAADARGRIWISLNPGLSVTDTARPSRRTLPARAHIEEVLSDGVALDLRGGMRIGPRPQRVTLAYTGLSLSVPERVTFRYRLDGYDSDWSAPVSGRQSVYTNLGPGPYRFRVMASNGDGWNGTEAAVSFDIAPAFWQTAWFRAGVIAMAALAGWSLYRLHVMQVAHRLNLRFEERLAERTRIAQDLHDTLLQGFVSASMQLHVAADRLPPESEARPALTRVLDLMSRVIEEGRNAVRGLRTSGDDADLAQAFAGVPEELALPGTARYRVIVEGKALPLNPMIRDDVFRIGREALVNAFRHSGAQAIEVEIEYGPGRLRLLVRDDGGGIDARVLQAGSDGHWGLPGMRERAGQIGARFTVWSRAAAGTEVELIVPGHLAYARRKKDA